MLALRARSAVSTLGSVADVRIAVADALQERFSGPDIRILTIITGVTIGTIYLVPQLVGAGHLFNLLIPIEALGSNATYIFWVGIAGGFTAVIVVLGGIYESTNRDDVTSVPFFGELPYLGRLFKRTSTRTDKQELLVFVTPKILSETLSLSAN